MKKQLTVIVLILGLPILFMQSCTKASEQGQINPPTGECDTTAMKYTLNIVPILQSNCYGCHGIGNTGGSGGILLEGYNNIVGYATNGTLKGVITHTGSYPPMPYGLPKLDDCTINKILDWINQGAPDN